MVINTMLKNTGYLFFLLQVDLLYINTTYTQELVSQKFKL